MSVLYISPLDYGSNASIDAMAHSLEHTLTQAGIEFAVAYADFRKDKWRSRTEKLIHEAVAAEIEAIVLYTLDPDEPAAAVAQARTHGVPVITLERPHFTVDASLVLPNFNHGVYMAEFLSRQLPPGARVGVIGGPGTPDDDELVLGIMRGLKLAGLKLVNDPMQPRYRNFTDDRAGGRAKTGALLRDCSRLDALVPYNDESALGAVDMLAVAGRLGELKTVSRNGTPNAVELVRNGMHDGTWDLDTLGIGRSAAQLVIEAVRGGNRLDGLCVAAPIGQMISAERAQSWIPWERRMTFAPLRIWEPNQHPATRAATPDRDPTWPARR
jgi:ABC-type sugar transport system substrate-binding protein